MVSHANKESTNVSNTYLNASNDSKVRLNMNNILSCCIIYQQINALYIYIYIHIYIYIYERKITLF